MNSVAIIYSASPIEDDIEYGVLAISLEGSTFNFNIQIAKSESDGSAAALNIVLRSAIQTQLEALGVVFFRR